MANRGDQPPYDPYIPAGGATGPQTGEVDKSGNPRIAAIQGQIDATTKIMHENLVEGARRGGKIEDLHDKTETLANSAQGFRRGANKVRKQMWWKDMKMRMCLIAGIVILLVVIIVPSVVASKH